MFDLEEFNNNEQRINDLDIEINKLYIAFKQLEDMESEHTNLLIENYLEHEKKFSETNLEEEEAYMTDSYINNLYSQLYEPLLEEFFYEEDYFRYLDKEQNQEEYIDALLYDYEEDLSEEKYIKNLIEQHLKEEDILIKQVKLLDKELNDSTYGDDSSIYEAYSINHYEMTFEDYNDMFYDNYEEDLIYTKMYRDLAEKYPSLCQNYYSSNYEDYGESYNLDYGDVPYEDFSGNPYEIYPEFTGFFDFLK
ncbi:hypothetical protein [Methanobrevibacter sp.]